MAPTRKCFSIDIGSTRTRIFLPRKGLIIDEPTQVVRNRNNNSYVSFGEESAAEQIAPHSVYEVVYPFKDGVIADYDATRALLAHYLYRVLGRFSFTKPDAIITVSGIANSSERRALLDAAYDAGFRKVYLIPTVYAAALGAGADIAKPKGTAIMHLGAGVSEFAIFALGSPVAQNTVKIGASTLDEAIRQRVRREHGVHLSTEQISELKLNYLDLNAGTAQKPVTFMAQKTRSKEQKKIILRNELLLRACEPQLERIVRIAKKVIDDCPPDIISDVIEQGVLLTGGLSKLRGIDTYLSNRLKLACLKVDEPILSPVRGVNMTLTHLKDYEHDFAAQLSSKSSIESKRQNA